MDAGAFFRFRRELFQTKLKIHKRLFALLLVFALVIGLLPSVLADNDPSTAESAEETLVESQPEESPAISPPTQSIPSFVPVHSGGGRLWSIEERFRVPSVSDHRKGQCSH